MFWFLACISDNGDDTASYRTVIESPVDDPASYDVDTNADYRLELGTPNWVVPSDSLPPEVETQASNNNVDMQKLRVKFLIFYEFLY